MKVFEFLPEFSNVKEIKKEVKIGNSRIDFVLDNAPLEVKDVSLVRDGIALFPDAPTERGARHVKEIIEHNGIILFLVDPNSFAKILARVVLPQPLGPESKMQ